MRVRWLTCTNKHAVQRLRRLPYPSSRFTRQPGATTHSTPNVRLRGSALASQAAAQEAYTALDTPESIYDSPVLYQQAFSFRNVEQEVAFIRDCARHFRSELPLTCTLELGCGPASHTLQLAAQLEGRHIGLDTNLAMLDYAQQQADQQQLHGQVHFMHADMQEFELQDGTASVDVAFCLLGTWCHLLDNSSALDTLRNVHRYLQQDGLLILEVEHPEHLFSGCLMDAYGTEGRLDEWDINLDEDFLPQDLKGARMLVKWGSETDTFDCVRQVIMRHVRLEVEGGKGRWQGTIDEGETTPAVVVEECVAQRMWTYQEIKLLSEVTGFSVVGEYGTLDMEVDLESEDAYRMVLVLQKQ